MDVDDDGVLTTNGDDDWELQAQEAIAREVVAEGRRPRHVLERLREEGFDVTRGRLRTLLRRTAYSGFTDISDDELIAELRDILSYHHANLGNTLATAALEDRGIHVQRERIRDALRRARTTSRNAPPRTLRKQYFNGVRPDFVWCIDSNCKLAQLFKIYIHAAIDGFSRKCKFFWVSLRLDSGSLYQAFLEQTRNLGHLPRHIRLDRHKGWKGIASLVHALLGPRRPDWVYVGQDQYLQDDYVKVHTVQYGKSTQNTPVETQWRFTSDMTAKWYNEFYGMQERGELAECEDPNFAIDLWCLHRVYLRPIVTNLEAHYRIMNLRHRRHSSKSPFHLAGPPNDIYRKYTSLAITLSEDDFDRADASLAENHNTVPSEPAAYEVSPLHGTASEGAFEELARRICAKDRLSLRRKYLKLRCKAYEWRADYDLTSEDSEEGG
mmetsp:Transcript_7947/g.26094  ORF Transcript_7947/g.26094 Transcript_7947/m.26094 type:complete len:438 (-) Transcript_7947:173-1486(-)|eukprot:CAMPEP_0118894848 /NCGR_PEP_ID=MMETSP1166-20130328/3456_1 /TAXON_ID=1104430 /ORGANISM="Chrysoreinhardia sp, Strain CCMP3193" /LENGTH=437 /DNA_ID=CAMNT_0006833805 /DNA_START=508 /DNA_END=1821 /DNA_ORIENTATION=+